MLVRWSPSQQTVAVVNSGDDGTADYCFCHVHLQRTHTAIQPLLLLLLLLLQVLAVKCDVRDPHSVRDAVSECIDRLGHLPTIVINNAAGNFVSPTERLSVNAWRTIIDIVLMGTVNVTMDVGKRLIAAGYSMLSCTLSSVHVSVVVVVVVVVIVLAVVVFHYNWTQCTLCLSLSLLRCSLAVLYTVFRKNTHSCFLVYICGKRLDQHRIFRLCLWRIRYSKNQVFHRHQI